MSGWTLSLLGYAGLWIILNFLAWGSGSVQVVDGPGVRELRRQAGELFLAMPDEVLLLECSDEGTSERILREVAGMDLYRHEVRHA